MMLHWWPVGVVEGKGRNEKAQNAHSGHPKPNPTGQLKEQCVSFLIRPYHRADTD